MRRFVQTYRQPSDCDLSFCYSPSDDPSSLFTIPIPNSLSAEEIGTYLHMELLARGYSASQLSIGFDDGAAPSKLNASPPGLAELLFLYLGPGSQVDEQLGDLEEIFHRNVKTVGIHRARMRYTAHVIRSVASSTFDRLRRLGAIGLISEMIRRWYVAKH